MTRRYYDWGATMSRQTGTHGEICIVVGAKNIGKTFGLRKRLVDIFLDRGERFCEICRTKEELRMVRQGYFAKLQASGLYGDLMFKVTGQTGYVARRPGGEDAGGRHAKAEWRALCYFVALTSFQAEKKRTYEGVTRFVFDEAIIDHKDRYHRYLPDEFLILANLLDSISRQQPGGDQYRVYILGNSCDLTCPYLRNYGITKAPSFGYTFFRHKTVLLHYVEPWDEEDMEARTLVGRMLSGSDEEGMVFGNRFDTGDSGDVCRKSPGARFAFAVRYAGNTFAAWVDHAEGLCWISQKVPKGAANVVALTKRDATVDYVAVDKASPSLRFLNGLFYAGCLRYEDAGTRELFLSVLDFLGIR